MTTTDDILRNALYAGAKATDEIAPGQGKHLRKFADELYPKSKPNFTPGPWRVYDEFEITADSPDDNATIANAYQCGGIREVDEAIANARLIATSPALYEALRRAKDTIRAFNGLGMKGEVEQACWDAYQHSPEMKQINAALAAVEGENS